MTDAEKMFRAGAKWAIENAEITEHNGWHKTEPHVDYDYMVKLLEAHVEILREKGKL